MMTGPASQPSIQPAQSRWRGWNTFNIVRSCLYCILLATTQSATKADDTKWVSPEYESAYLSREPYDFPFTDYEDWLSFMDRAPDPEWHATPMRSLVSNEAFSRYKAQQTLVTERIVYSSQGLRINGFLIAPRQANKPLPVILFAHGGVGEWGRITFFDLLELHRLAEQGYIILASALRGEMGSEGMPNLGSGDLADMLRLLDIADDLPEADNTRVGLWGFSRGGGLSYRILAATDRISAAVLVGAPSNLVDSPRREEFHEHVYPGIVDGYADDQDAALKALSAAYWPQLIYSGTPVLLLHGARDERVEPGNSLEMAGHFTRLQHPFRLVVFEGGSHTLVGDLPAYRAELDQWFARYLQQRP